jgi:heme a synthase
MGLGLLGVWQLATGLSNVVLGWPIVAAVSHTGGAALLAVLLASLLARAYRRDAATLQRATQTARPIGV